MNAKLKWWLSWLVLPFLMMLGVLVAMQSWWEDITESIEGHLDLGRRIGAIRGEGK